MATMYVQALWNHVLHIDADGKYALCGWDWGSSQWNTLRASAGNIDVCDKCISALEGSS